MPTTPTKLVLEHIAEAEVQFNRGHNTHAIIRAEMALGEDDWHDHCVESDKALEHDMWCAALCLLTNAKRDVQELLKESSRLFEENLQGASLNSSEESFSLFEDIHYSEKSIDGFIVELNIRAARCFTIQ